MPLLMSCKNDCRLKKSPAVVKLDLSDGRHLRLYTVIRRREATADAASGADVCDAGWGSCFFLSC